MSNVNFSIDKINYRKKYERNIIQINSIIKINKKYKLFIQFHLYQSFPKFHLQ